MKLEKENNIMEKKSTLFLTRRNFDPSSIELTADSHIFRKLPLPYCTGFHIGFFRFVVIENNRIVKCQPAALVSYIIRIFLLYCHLE